MRILHVVTAFPRTPDDVIVPWLVELLRRLRAAGYGIEVFTSAYRGGGPDQYDGLPVHRFRYAPARWEDLTHDEAAPDRLKRSWRYRLLAVTYVVGGAWGVWRLCRRQSYDVVHVHWAMPHALFGWIARWTCRARIVTTFYGVELRWTRSRLGPLRWMIRRAARSSDRAVAISRSTQADVQQLGRPDVLVIPYGVGIAAEPRTTTPGSGTPFTILFVGRLVARKGVEVLLRALSRMAPQLDARAVVVGEGPELEPLRALAAHVGVASRVTFTGRIAWDALASAYRTASVVVLPAVLDDRGDTEGLGVVLLEAMQLGVPVVGSDLGGIPDIVEHETSGLLVPSGDADALAAALVRLAQDPALAARLGEAGRIRATELFGWPAVVSRWRQVYDGLRRAL